MIFREHFVDGARGCEAWMERTRDSLAIVTFGVAVAVGAPAHAEPLPDAVRPQVQEFVQQADLAGFPSERLLTKAQEGVAKGIAPDRILSVLGTMFQWMNRAGVLVDGLATRRLDPKDRRTLVGDIATALELGVDEPALAELAKAGLIGRQNPRSLHGALTALTDLTAQGSKGPDVRALVLLALEEGFSDTDFPKLVRALHDLAGSVGLDEAMNRLHAVVASGHGPDWLDRNGLDPSRGPPPGVGKNGKGAGKTRPVEPRARP